MEEEERHVMGGLLLPHKRVREQDREDCQGTDELIKKVSWTCPP